MTSTATRAEQRTEQRLAKKRVHLIPDERRTHPPAVEELWARAWYCLYVAPFREQRVRAELLRAGLSVYLPVSTYWSSARYRTKRQRERALLTRYLFVGCGHRGQARISDDDLSKIRAVERHGIQDTLSDEITGLPLAVPVENLVAFVGRQVSGEWDATTETFAAGQKVMITKKSLAGFSATLEQPVHRGAAPDDPISVIITLFGRQTVTRVPLADLVATD